MRQLLAVALVLAVGAIPMCAQRGGARGGGSSGFHGGFSGHAGVASRGGFSGGGFSRGSQYRYAGGPMAPGYRPGSLAFGADSRAEGGRSTGLRAPGRSPSLYNRGRDYRRRYGYEGGVPYIYPGIYSGWDGYELGYPDFDGYDDDGYYYGDDSVNGQAGAYPDVQSEDYGQQPEEPYEQPEAQYQAAPVESAQASAAALAQDESPALYDSDAVTLVFKDGRPPEEIHNYALTRTTLYVTGAHHREIPVADLDLAATEKANRAAGVSFQLPQAGQ